MATKTSRTRPPSRASHFTIAEVASHFNRSVWAIRKALIARNIKLTRRRKTQGGPFLLTWKQALRCRPQHMTDQQADTISRKLIRYHARSRS